MRYVLVLLAALVASAVVARAVLSWSPSGRRLTGQPVDLWSAGMETGDLSEWEIPGPPTRGGGEFNSDGGDAIADTTVARTGRWSARLTIPEGRAGTRLFRWRESHEYEEAYYSAWFYFPTTYVPEVWWNIFQFKTRTQTRNDPAWAINVGNRSNGAMYLYVFDAFNDRSHSQVAVDLPVETWVNITCFLRQSGFQRGQLKCWQDGVLLWDLDGITTTYPEGVNEWSVNNYSDLVSPSPSVLYIDDASISTVPVFPSLQSDTVVSGFDEPIPAAATVLDGRGDGWSATHGAAPWVTLTVADGFGTGHVQWEKSALDLLPGIYVDTIRVTSPQFGMATVVDSLIVAAPFTAAEAAIELMVGTGLTERHVAFLARFGNRDRTFNLGDVLGWYDRCLARTLGGCKGPSGP